MLALKLAAPRSIQHASSYRAPLQLLRQQAAELAAAYGTSTLPAWSSLYNCVCLAALDTAQHNSSTALHQLISQ